MRGRVLGCDVSHHQGDIDWRKLRAAGVRFAIIKATEGTKYVDPRLVRNWIGALRAGIIPGAYHLVHLTRDDLAAQAKHYLNATIDLPGGASLPAALDIETTRIDECESPAVAVRRLEQWLRIVRDATHRRPLVYLSPRDYGLTEPEVPSAWSTWTVRQWTSKALGADYGVRSRHVDLDWWRGSLRDLRRWCTRRL